LGFLVFDKYLINKNHLPVQPDASGFCLSSFSFNVHWFALKNDLIIVFVPICFVCGSCYICYWNLVFLQIIVRPFILFLGGPFSIYGILLPIQYLQTLSKWIFLQELEIKICNFSSNSTKISLEDCRFKLLLVLCIFQFS
jgi:hypothetical protein